MTVGKMQVLTPLHLTFVNSLPSFFLILLCQGAGQLAVVGKLRFFWAGAMAKKKTLYHSKSPVESRTF